jgi:hypothetical protein
MTKKISNVALLTFEGAAFNDILGLTTDFIVSFNYGVITKQICPKNMSNLSGMQPFFVRL